MLMPCTALENIPDLSNVFVHMSFCIEGISTKQKLWFPGRSRAYLQDYNKKQIVRNKFSFHTF